MVRRHRPEPPARSPRRPPPPAVADVVRSPGRPLTRGLLGAEPASDLRSVRVHDDAAAARSTQSLHALAWAHGDHVALSPEARSSGVRARTLRHELVHVRQQRRGVAPGGGRDAEAEAERGEARTGMGAPGATARTPVQAKPVAGVPKWQPPVAVRQVDGGEHVLVGGIAVAKFSTAPDETLDRVGVTAHWEPLPEAEQGVRNGNSVSLRFIVHVTYRNDTVHFRRISKGKALVEAERMPSAKLSVRLGVKAKPRKKVPWRETPLGKFYEKQDREKREAELEAERAILEREIGKILVAGQVGHLHVDPGERLRMWGAVGAVVIPVAEVVSFLVDFVPYAGSFKMLAEAASGRDIGGIGHDLEDSERLLRIALVAIPPAVKILKAGRGGARAILRISRATGRSPGEVIRTLQRLRSLSSRRGAIKTALEKLRKAKAAGKPPPGPAPKVPPGGQGNQGGPFYKPTAKGDPTKPAGTGGTNKYGDYWYSTKGTQAEQDLAKFHEQVHSFLAPKLKPLREWRATKGMEQYKKSPLLRYIEEALAESVAQLRVNGIKGLPTGVRFPIKNGYIEVAEHSQLAKEAAIGTVLVSGYVYTVYLIATQDVGDDGPEDIYEDLE